MRLVRGGGVMRLRIPQRIGVVGVLDGGATLVFRDSGRVETRKGTRVE